MVGRNNGPIAQGTYHGMTFIRSAGAKGDKTYQGMSPDGLTVDGYINTPEALAAFQWLQDVHVKDKLVPLDSLPDAFATGKAPCRSSRRHCTLP